MKKSNEEKKLGMIKSSKLSHFMKEPEFTKKYMVKKDVLESLSRVVNIDLVDAKDNVQIGPFFVDNTFNGNNVLCETQYGKSDHDHLGKSLTYTSNLDKEVCILIAEEFRPEHIKVFEFLNEQTNKKFFLVKLTTFNINNSAQIKFELITGPENSKQIGKEKKETFDRHEQNIKFWTQLLEKMNKKTDLFEGVSPNGYELSRKRENSIYEWYFRISNNTFIVGLYIGRDVSRVKNYQSKIEKSYKNLIKNKTKIEKEFGKRIDWGSDDKQILCKITSTISENQGKENEFKWNRIQNKMINRMIKLEKVLRPYLK